MDPDGKVIPVLKQEPNVLIVGQINLAVPLPKNARPGDYSMHVHMKDYRGGSATDLVVPFRVQAEIPKDRPGQKS